MLIHHLSGRTSEWCLASRHYPERYAKRVQIRTDVHLHSSELLGAGKIRGPDKAPRHRNGGLRTRFIDCLGQPKVDDLCSHTASLLEAHHDVTRFDVPMNEFLLVDRSQTGGDLCRDFERQVYFKPP